MKKYLVCVISLILVLVLVVPMTSCSTEVPNLEDVKERFVYLIEESKEMNVIFFGVGLPVYREDSDIADKKMVYVNSDVGEYDRVMEKSEYISIDAIKIAASKIYSEDYLSDMYESAFDGVVTGEAKAYVRFYDNSEWLFQNRNLYDFTVDERIYDYSTMKIMDPSSTDYINISVETYSITDNVRRIVYLSFSFENGNWYLDAPTY